ncbi:type I-E CRISPR-associated protein Cse2/CasB [Desulfuromonas thiophila]|uniref:type I-E CRISPR-associated protein Cse2/CasB n=1 Tax=Desulfuromonas thiophila TaxID=57664 RepID=UPI0029F54A41|nr:type I-E CRISPR-associated protein Cse2/CasB [Desulfuromonas thiophila]
MKKYQFLNDSETRDKLLEWWDWLDGSKARFKKNHGRADRARLRRVESPDDVLLTEAFYHFLQNMPESWSESKHLPVSALTAAIVSHVKEHDASKSFAEQLATTKDASDKPFMSELRFRQLQKSHDPSEFCRRLLRAVKMLDGRVNIISLVNDVFHWMYEYQSGVDRNPQERLAFCWANDYYRTLLKRQPKSNTKGGTP